MAQEGPHPRAETQLLGAFTSFPFSAFMEQRPPWDGQESELPLAYVSLQQ